MMHHTLATLDLDRTEGESNKDASSVTYTSILGTRINPIPMKNVIDLIEQWISNGNKQYVAACTAHSLIEADKNWAFQEVLNGAGLCTLDGMPLVWLARRDGFSNAERVCGPDLMLELCGRSSITGHRHFFYGGSAGTAELLAEKLSARYPGLRLAGVHTPGKLEVGQMENPEIVSAINHTRPDIVWVGLGCPKQEWWAANHLESLTSTVIIAVGAAFDFHSGKVKKAPQAMQQIGLEWLYRLANDPRRLWRKYLVGNSVFVAKVLAERTKPQPK